MTLHVGIDVGGTFTDTVAILDGRAERAKAFSTPDVTGGIVAALEVLQRRLGLAEGDFYPAIERLVLGSTIVTNAVDEQKFGSVGLLTTHGFRDTLRIARSSRGDERNPHRLTAPPDIVDRRRIVEVTERVDANGDVLIPLTERAIATAVDEVVASGAKTVAVCLLWSFRNPEHERQIGAYLDAHHPELPYSLSSRLTPVYREYERMVTTALDAAVKPLVATHFETLSERLRGKGLQTSIQVMQVHGGFLSVTETSKAPISMFNSGPVGGVTGARLLGLQLDRSRLLTTDMGGTSLDAAAIIDGEVRVLPRAEIGGLPTSLTAVDIETIGAGGGSLAWVDGRGIMRIGPQSAGSTPGPACYGKGGEQPTVTDAAVTLGLLNPDYYLGGEVSLDVDKARQAIQTHLAEPTGLSVDDAARGVYRLAVSQMALAVRKISVNRGHDPREFTLVGFGGACGLFASAIAADLGMTEIVIPRNASVFSAHGLLHADSVFSAVQTTPWTFSQPATELEQVYGALEQQAREWFTAEGIAEDEQELYREADIKFVGQIFEVITRLPSESFTEDTKDVLRQRFIEDYEAEFGTGTAWAEAEILLVNSRVRAIGRTETQTVAESGQGDQHSAAERDGLDPISGQRGPLVAHRGFSSIRRADGPCLIEEPDTTVFVPAGWTATVGVGGHFLLTSSGAA